MHSKVQCINQTHIETALWLLHTHAHTHARRQIIVLLRGCFPELWLHLDSLPNGYSLHCGCKHTHTHTHLCTKARKQACTKANMQPEAWEWMHTHTHAHCLRAVAVHVVVNTGGEWNQPWNTASCCPSALCLPLSPSLCTHLGVSRFLGHHFWLPFPCIFPVMEHLIAAFCTKVVLLANTCESHVCLTFSCHSDQQALQQVGLWGTKNGYEYPKPACSRSCKRSESIHGNFLILRSNIVLSHDCIKINEAAKCSAKSAEDCWYRFTTLHWLRSWLH